MRIYTPRVVADRIMMQDDFVRLHKFLLETDAISVISTMSERGREGVARAGAQAATEETECFDRSTPRGGSQFSRTTLLRGKWAQSIVAKSGTFASFASRADNAERELLR